MGEKMTSKEFENILTACGMTFEAYGYDGVLNMLSLCMDYSAEYSQSRGHEAAAKVYEDRARMIYACLSSRGYYDKVEKDLEGRA